MCPVSGAQLEIRCCGCTGELGSSSTHPDLSLCCALPGRMTASLWSLLVPWGIHPARAGCAAAELRLCCLTLYISRRSEITEKWNMKISSLFPSPHQTVPCPSSYPTKSQVTLVCMPAGMDMVISVLFTTENNSAFDCIIFWGYSQSASLFTLVWKLSWNISNRRRCRSMLLSPFLPEEILQLLTHLLPATCYQLTSLSIFIRGPAFLLVW